MHKLENDYPEIEKDINSGLPTTAVMAKYDIGRKALFSYLKKKNIILLEEIIKNSRREAPSTIKQRSIERYRQTEILYGKIIEEMILNGEHMSPILKKTGMSLGYFRNFIRWKSQKWVKLLSENSKKFVSDDAVRKSKMGGAAAKTIAVNKSIPQEIQDSYFDLLKNNIHLAEIKRLLICQFAITEHYIDYTLVKRLGKPKRANQSGVNNPMYGKSPSKQSGIGAKGYIYDNSGVKLYFRSSLEMKIYVHLIENNIKFKITNIRIKYLDSNNTPRTYVPDIEIGNKLIEIKPSILINDKNNINKFITARQYCIENGMDFIIYTENDFCVKDFSKEKLDLLVQTGKIAVDERNYNKIVKYIGVK
jgi:hypothetical protein